MSINFLAILIAAIAAMALGAVWYSPILFANAWLKAIGKTNLELNKKDMGKTYAVQFLGAIVMALAINGVLNYTGFSAKSVLVGFLIILWLVVAFAELGDYLFLKRGMKLYLINVFAQLANILLIGWIVWVWR